MASKTVKDLLGEMLKSPPEDWDFKDKAERDAWIWKQIGERLKARKKMKAEKAKKAAAKKAAAKKKAGK